MQPDLDGGRGNLSSVRYWTDEPNVDSLSKKWVNVSKSPGKRRCRGQAGQVQGLAARDEVHCRRTFEGWRRGQAWLHLFLSLSLSVLVEIRLLSGTWLNLALVNGQSSRASLVIFFVFQLVMSSQQFCSLSLCLCAGIRWTTVWFECECSTGDDLVNPTN